jgi:Holliday junction resolvase RusA-like endonuclease
LIIKVEGTPAPKGSKSLYNGRMVEANKGLPAWNKALETAFKNYRQTDPIVMIGAIQVEILFLMPRPKSVSRERPTVKPDVDKLCRTVLDAAERAGIYFNDSQVIDLSARKRYADIQTPGAVINIEQL